MPNDPTAFATVVTASVGAVGTVVTLLIRKLTNAYDRRISDLVVERDHYRLLAEAQRGELERNALADERALYLLNMRLSGAGKATV